MTKIGREVKASHLQRGGLKKKNIQDEKTNDKCSPSFFLLLFNKHIIFLSLYFSLPHFCSLSPFFLLYHFFLSLFIAISCSLSIYFPFPFFFFLFIFHAFILIPFLSLPLHFSLFLSLFIVLFIYFSIIFAYSLFPLSFYLF